MEVSEKKICALLADAMETGRRVGRAEGIQEAAALCEPGMKLRLLELARASLDEAPAPKN